MTPAVQRKLLAAAAAALLGIGCRDSMTARPVADLSAGGVRVTGTGQIQDAASPPSWWDEFNFDVRSDLTGKLVYNEHWYRPDGSYVVLVVDPSDPETDRKSTRMNSSHLVISYAVFCLKKKKKRKSTISVSSSFASSIPSPSSNGRRGSDG